ncbi:MAG: NAD(P)-dependent dehydrogenase (short-subunit alcohol dehydrogenase family) [Candidatus Poriferisodalaceae bacterium]|jgi:NAD(P)-dependent dehydrogenase (short-subunit alcohol dehydrogenase family)
MLIEFTDKVVVITGSSGGFGLATAEAFLESGASVMLNGTNPAKLETALEGLHARFDKVHGCVADIATSDGVAQLFDKTEQKFESLDVLINNAAVGRNTAFLDISEDEWTQMLDVNLKGCVLTSQAFARRSISAARSGKIVNILSGNYLWTRAGAAHYSASKAALEMLTRSMALELGPHKINVNAVAPGLMDLSKRGGRGPAQSFVDIYVKGVPLGRVGEVEDVTGAVLFMASEQASFVTGSTILVDGGYASGRADLPLAPPPAG